MLLNPWSSSNRPRRRRHSAVPRHKYRVEASYGHIRDLPESAAEVPKEIKEKDWGRLGVDVDERLHPYYVVPNDKRKQVAHLKTGDQGRLGTAARHRPDREGESISWHLAQVLKPKIPVRASCSTRSPRTPSGSARASVRRQREPRARAGEPPHSRSAVRLHAVAGALEEGADRAQRGPRAERGRPPDRRARGRAPRVPHGVYWDLEATLKARARVRRDAGARQRPAVATGKDFDAQTGALKNQNVALLDEAATALVTAIRANVPWTVHVGRAEAGRRAAGRRPFTTSTLTQEASRKLGFSTERTMQVAQRLFQGLDTGTARWKVSSPITARIRPRCPRRALNESARVIGEMFGSSTTPGRAAIRPA
jgi:DNA topoisomerase-1